MDIRKLEAFAKVYEQRSFSKAGQDLFLSQPTISAHVSSLESELEVRLFDRLGRNILPTQAADVLYKRTQEVFSALASAKAEIQLLQERIAGDLVVGGSTIPANYILPSLLARFAKKYPEVRLSLKVGDSQDVINRIAQGEDLVGVVGTSTDHPDLVSEMLLRDELIIVGSPGALPKDKTKYSASDLVGLPWIVREQGSGTRMAFEQGLEKLTGLRCRDLRTALAVESTVSALHSARAGLGVTATSRLAVREYLESGELVSIDIKGLSMPRSFHIVYHSRRHHFPVMRYFIDFLQQECRLGG